MIQDLVVLEREINTHRAAFNIACMNVRSLTAAVAADAELTANHLISMAQEYGVAHTLDVLRERPAEFAVRHVSELQATSLAVPLANAQSALLALDRLTAQKTLALRAVNPDQPDLYQHFGREMAYDPARGVMRFTDDGSELALDEADHDDDRTNA